MTILLALGAVIIALQVAALLRGRGGDMGERLDRVEREVRLQLQATAQAQRQEMGHTLAQSHAATVQQLDSMRRQIEVLTESNVRRLAEVRATLEVKMRELQTDNGARL